MNYKRKTGFTPSGQTMDIPSGALAQRLDTSGLEEPALPGIFPASRPRRFHIGWIPTKAVPAPFESPVPCIYIIDQDTDILLRAVMSGVHQTELEVVVNEDSVHIRGRVRCDEDELKGKFEFPEIFSEIFFRNVELPGHVDSARATAEFDDDVLEMTLPKMVLTN